MNKVILNGVDLSIEDVVNVARNGYQVEIDKDCMAHIAEVRNYMESEWMRDDAPAVRARARPHLHQMVGFGEYLRIVIHQQHGIAVRNQIAHHPRETGDVGGMQPDGGLVQHV